MKYALFLLLLSCGAPGHEYMRGTMVAPPPAPARPGVGAPIRGQPGEPHAYPRSPYTRALPQTPETMRQPGIWAATPSAPLPSVLGVMLPLPRTKAPDKDVEAVSKCAAVVNGSIDMAEKRAAMRHIPDARRECIVAQLYLRCADLTAKATEQRRQSAIAFDGAAHNRVALMLDEATRFARGKCATKPLTPEDDTLWTTIAAAMENFGGF